MPKDKTSKSEKININSGKGDITMSGVNIGGQNNKATYKANYIDDSGDRNSVDPQILAEELSILLEALREEATDIEQIAAMGDVANAQLSAKQGNLVKAGEYLGKTGKWVLEVAQKVCTQVAAKFIQHASGIG